MLYLLAVLRGAMWLIPFLFVKKAGGSVCPRTRSFGRLLNKLESEASGLSRILKQLSIAQTAHANLLL